MATFPESSPTPRYPLTIEIEYNTLISNFDGGTEQRRKKLMFPRYNIIISYPYISKTEAQVLWDFYIARSGAYESFYVYDLSLLLDHSFTHTGLYCGTGDGSTTTFDIPGRSVSSTTVYKDGNDYSSSTTILTGGGSSDSDRVRFNSNTPSAGEIVTIDFMGFLRMLVRFKDDNLTRENFINQLYSMGIQLKGLSC